jgi:glycosyltransferase involved in cell wall biosynthesis
MHILYIQYTNPAAYPPLEHSSHILAKDGWQVLFLGTGAHGANDLKFAAHKAICVRQIRYVEAGWKQKLNYLYYLLWVISWTILWHPDWIYVSDPLACPVALLLSFFSKVRIIYHEHDSPSPSSGAKLSIFTRFVMWCRFQLAQRIDLAVLPNDARLESFQKMVKIHRPMFTVWNCPRLDEVTPEIQCYKNRNLRILYQGSIVPPRLPIKILDALAMLPDTVKLDVIGYTTIGHHDYVQQLQARIIELGLTERVKLWDAMPRYELLIECRNFDIGLAFVPFTTEDINLVEMIGASNKVFDYMASGLALLVSDLPAWRQMYVEPRYGLACNPYKAESIVQVLQWFIAHPDERCLMGQKGRQRILDDWNYEQEFTPVKRILDAINKF